jgi:predicted AAA+ superfamily ATPase
LLENVVALEFYRRRLKTFYRKNKSECDFIVQIGLRPEAAWQVCWELSLANEKREIQGLLEAMRSLKIKKGGILTYNQEETRKVDGETIRMIPVWKWLLTDNEILE